MPRAHDFGGGYVPVSDRREMRTPDCMNPDHVPFGTFAYNPKPGAFVHHPKPADTEYAAWFPHPVLSREYLQAYCEVWDEAWDKRIADRQAAVVTGDDPAPKRVGPDDPAHNTARDLIEHVIADRVTKPARDAVRKALDAADAPPQGKLASGAHRSPPNLGRALRGSFDVTGLHTGKAP